MRITSKLGSRKRAKNGWDNACSAVYLSFGLMTSILSSKSQAIHIYVDAKKISKEKEKETITNLDHLMGCTV